MKIAILIFALVAICVAEEIESKKHGVQKGSSLNAIPSNNHQKPETSNYKQSYIQQQQTQQQQSPTAPQDYQQQDIVTQQHPSQQIYNVPQIIPLHIVQQPVLAAPRFQILASRNPTGQMQLTLIPHNVFMNLVYGNSLFNNPLGQPLLTNHIQQQSTAPPAAVTPTIETAYNNYVTPQPLVYSQSNSVPLSQSNYYSSQQVPLPYTYNSASQPQPIVYSQPAPTYNHHNYITPSVSNSAYSPNSNQLVNYYQTNPQTKYQLLYGSNQQQYDQTQNYQTIPSSEYEKSNLVQSHQIHKNDVSLHTNEYISPPDTHFRPIHAYHRTPVSYKS